MQHPPLSLASALSAQVAENLVVPAPTEENRAAWLAYVSPGRRVGSDPEDVEHVLALPPRVALGPPWSLARAKAGELG